MDNNILENIACFETLILIKIRKNDNVVFSPFEYISGSFESVGVNNFKNFNELISSIYKSATICEGIGYYEYCNQIKESIYYCQSQGIRHSFILPILYKDKTYYFLMNITRSGEDINALFIYFEKETGLYDIESYLSGTFKDNLTGLFNYNTFASHIRDNRRNGYLCLFDLNKFKYINDTFGHDIGDKVLISIANFLIKIASMSEVFYRRSGDEFLILVFEKPLEYVLNLMNKIESHIEELNKELKKDFDCSAAFGLLELKFPKEEEPFDLDTQAELIDLAMYQAKGAKKRYHLITHEDALEIIKKGDLKERIARLSKTIRR